MLEPQPAHTSPAQTFGIAVTPVNDVPSFAPGADQVVSEDGGAQSVSGWATRIDAGAANEAGQGVSFIVSTDDRVLFASGGEPRVGTDGTLAYRSAANAVGKATVTIRVHDDGGTADGGIDTGPGADVADRDLRAVDGPRRSPAGWGQTVLEDVGLQTVAGWAKGISPGPADEASQTVGFLVDSDKPSLFSRQPGVAGDGTLTYTPAANANGTATVSVRGRDDGGTANGGVDTSAAQTFTITMTPVDDAPVANADAATAVEDDVSGVTFNVLANDSDVDAGDTLSVSSYDGSTVPTALSPPTAAAASRTSRTAASQAPRRSRTSSPTASERPARQARPSPSMRFHMRRSRATTHTRRRRTRRSWSELRACWATTATRTATR